MKCEKCQEPVLDSDTFCPECGTPQSIDRKCIHCGAPVKPKQKFCSACGKAIAELTCSCGHSLKPDQKFCNGCGKKVEHVPTQLLHCTKCRAVVEGHECYCSVCGTSVPDASLLTTPTPCSEEPGAGKVDIKDGTASAATQPLESGEFSSPNDGTSEKEEDKKCLTVGTGGEQPSPVTGGGEQTTTTLNAETAQSQETNAVKAETSKTEGEGIGGSPGDSVTDPSGSSEGGEPDKDTIDEGADSCATDNRQSQTDKPTDRDSESSEFSSQHRSTSEKEEDGKCLTVGTGDGQPSPVTGGGEQTTTTLNAETIDEGAESCTTGDRQNQTGRQADSEPGNKEGPKLPEKALAQRENPSENQSAIDGSSNKPSGAPEAPPNGAEALPQAKSIVDPGTSVSNTKRDGASSQEEDPGSQPGNECTVT